MRRSSSTSLPTAPALKRRHVWRRLHAGQLIAQVSRADGREGWVASAYSTRNHRRVVRAETNFTSRIQAERAADRLVYETYTHICKTGECGRWLRWPE